MEELNQVESAIDVARGISEFGLLIVIAAFFLVLSGLLMIASFRWFKQIINRIVDRSNGKMDTLISMTEKQNDLINDIADALRPTTMMQIKNISNTAFDLSVERVCRMIQRIREENHIIDKEATKDKIRVLISNIHADRNSRFDTIQFRGHSLSHYTNEEWIDWICEIVEKEVYSETQNSGRTFTNVDSVYSKIKIDFYNRLKL